MIVRSTRHLLLCAALSGAATPAIAQAQAAAEQRDADLVAVMRAQDERIRMLEARLAALEGPQRNPVPPVSARRDEEAGSLYPAPIRRSPEGPAPQAVAEATAPATPVKPLDLNVTWGQGAPVFARSDGSFTFKPRGRLLVDFDATTGSRLASRNVTTTGLRGGRLGVEGTFLRHGFYQFEADFAEGDIGIVGAFIGYQDRAGGVEYDVRLGNIFNDRSLEGQTGSLTTPFIERNFVANAILPQKGFYGMGAMTRVFGPDWHASLAVTGDPVDGAYAASDTLSAASRVHWNPVRGENGTIHVAGWGFWENLAGDARTITRNTPIGARFDSALRVSTGPLTQADRSVGYGGELGGIYRNMYVWGEYGRRRLTFLPGAPTADFDTDAWSLSTGIFLTGEKSPYSPRQGNILAPAILDSLVTGGIGAFELLGRLEKLDYSRTPLGGTGKETTLGLNWYPVPLVRFMVNWSHWTVDNRLSPLVGYDTGNSFTTRAQFSF